jgi:hypothetical protein
MPEINDPSHYFYAHDGKVLKSIAELLEFLEHVDDFTFSYHFNPQKNDFANWVGDTLKMDELSKRMYSAISREELYEVVKQEAEKPFEELKQKI